jgi:hypothetical protein
MLCDDAGLVCLSMTDIFTVHTEPLRGKSFWGVDSLAGDIGWVNESPAGAAPGTPCRTRSSATR